MDMSDFGPCPAKYELEVKIPDLRDIVKGRSGDECVCLV